MICILAKLWSKYSLYSQTYAISSWLGSFQSQYLSMVSHSFVILYTHYIQCRTSGLLVPLHSIFEEKRKRVGSQHWINHKTLKMQRFCQSYISKNWKFLIFFKFFKCAYTIFNNSRNINHQNGSESCPKSTKNSQTKGFPQSDTTTFRGYFYITAYVSEKQKCRRKKYRKISVTVRLVSA